MNFAHSNGEPGVLTPTTNINVRFVSISPLQLQIINSNSMNSSTSTQNKPMVPSLFQIAAHFEDYVHAAGVKKPALTLSRTDFADLVSHPEKWEAALNAARTGNDAFAASRSISRKDATSTTRNPPPNNGVIKNLKTHLPCELKKIEFCLEAPSAKSVKLAADFTHWEKFPHEMMRSENGDWFSAIWLAPGQYSYRFIVDGQWRDDPRATQRIPNPFGTENAVIAVT
jgi:hypothetical protein